MVKIDIARKLGAAWYGQWGADRQFFNALKQYFPNYSCSREYSLCYRLDGNPNSVNAEFFEKGKTRNNILMAFPGSSNSKRNTLWDLE